jgi:hypothetical protein
VPGYGPRSTPDPNSTWAPGTGRNLRVHQVLHDGAGKVALLYGEAIMLTCTIDGPAMKYNAGGGGASPSTLTGAIDVDFNSASSGGDLPGNKPIYRGLPGEYLVAGRIAPGVVRVTVTADGQTIDAVLANGTFIGRILKPSTWVVPDPPQPAQVRAFDANGNELPDEGAERAWPS